MPRGGLFATYVRGARGDSVQPVTMHVSSLLKFSEECWAGGKLSTRTSGIYPRLLSMVPTMGC